MAFTNSTIPSPNELSSSETGRSILLFSLRLTPEQSLVWCVISQHKLAPFVRLTGERKAQACVIAMLRQRIGSHWRKAGKAISELT